MKKRVTLFGDTKVLESTPFSLTFEIGEERLLIEDIEDKVYVGVEFPGKRGCKYTYIDPSKCLEIGDFVLVPTGPGSNLRTAIVKQLGKGYCPYNVQKAVHSKRVLSESWEEL